MKDSFLTLEHSGTKSFMLTTFHWKTQADALLHFLHTSCKPCDGNIRSFNGGGWCVSFAAKAECCCVEVKDQHRVNVNLGLNHNTLCEYQRSNPAADFFPPQNPVRSFKFTDASRCKYQRSLRVSAQKVSNSKK